MWEKKNENEAHHRTLEKKKDHIYTYTHTYTQYLLSSNFLHPRFYIRF